MICPHCKLIVCCMKHAEYLHENFHEPKVPK